MASIFQTLKSLVGRRLMLGKYGQLVASPNGTDIDLTMKCADASITVGAEVGDARAITIQLKDANGADIDYVEEVELVLFLTADRLAYVVTGGSTGIAIGTDGALSTVVAKKRFYATSEIDGDIDLTWTDTATEAAFLGLKLPSGRWVMSSALANA
ncbi:hypothetical protein LRP31_25540 [Mesorhizobium mediterraneum]|uniref:Phage tail protein n=1 Tax=Mesorhizobium mediterraneum TaxID=43617 RepID=A0AB36R8J5_9HYPH|nr:hypothetical protein [Mesorhizobium mediterraneum]PAQ00924.1 hypothetical protein CIT25_17815 [Mesorhizobium mediterraneum]WIW52386.1 hypothetical protein LRP31_25540 [Mesorhizobium mediterraneum]